MIMLVDNITDVTDSLQKYLSELSNSKTLQNRLPYIRSWYAIRKGNNQWVFGPSKFIGYKSLNASTYIDENSPLDGRVTEKKLQDFFSVVSEDDPLYNSLRLALAEFLSQYSKIPSKACRINVLNAYKGIRSKKQINKHFIGDSLYDSAIELIFTNQRSSNAYLQKTLGIKYEQATKLIQQLEKNNVIDNHQPSKTGQVLIGGSNQPTQNLDTSLSDLIVQVVLQLPIETQRSIVRRISGAR